MFHVEHFDLNRYEVAHLQSMFHVEHPIWHLFDNVPRGTFWRWSKPSLQAKCCILNRKLRKHFHIAAFGSPLFTGL